MNRRGFLGGLASLIVASPSIEEILKGRSMISLYTPSPLPIYRLTESQIIEFELKRILPMLPRLFDRDDTFFRALEKGKWVDLKDRQMEFKFR